jgi:hypothetical protein
MSKLWLARKYEPVLLFSKDGQGREENFFPLPVENYVLQCRLYHKGEGPVDVPGWLSLEALGHMNPRQSREYYLAYVADEVLSESPPLMERLQNGGLALYSVQGQVEPHLLVEPNLAVAFAAHDPALKRVNATGPGDVAFAPPGGGARSEGARSETGPSQGWAGEPIPEVDFLISDSQQLPVAIRDKAVDRYEPYRDFAAYPPVYYYHVMHNRGYLVIQYWFFYAYNDWGTSHGGVNDHEGDWEAVFVFLHSDGDSPAYVAYSAHIGSPEWHAWDDPALEKWFRNHPVVYVGCGSHANYFRPGTYTVQPLPVKDYAYGDSAVAIGAGTDVAWSRPVDLAQQAWALNYSGHWGALVKRWGAGWLAPGAQAPDGPAWKFPKWETPVKWAGIPY